MDWLRDRWAELAGLGSAGWLAIAAWAGLALGLCALLFTARVLKRNRQLKADELRPHVVVFMEPHPSDWHVIELVVRNFGQSAAHDVRLEFTTPLTVGRSEDGYPDGLPEIGELRLPSELKQLAPGQEWRTVWDSAISREEFGGQIGSRFEGTVRYRAGKREFESAVELDWSTLQPVQRLELMTTHDLAKREKQKLELLRSVLTYFHYASKETRPEVFRAEIDRMNRAVRETQDRWRTRQADETTQLDFPWIAEEQSGGRHHSSPAIGIRHRAP
ncbi:hypothetical protein ACWDUN_18200 [Mycobacterium sp. NPDC003323]